MKRRVVAVFGGGGFVGRHLVQRLTADSWIVRVAVRDPERVAFLKTMGDAGQVVPVWADVTDPSSVRSVVAGADAAVNAVGILSPRGKQTFRRAHVDGAANVARSASEAGVSALVHISAIGANADSSAEYARTKAAGEAAVREAFAGASIVRPSVVFGPEDDFFNRFARMAHVSPALPVFPTRFQPVFVGDVAEAIVRLLSSASLAGKTYELGGPRVMTFREACEIVLSMTRQKRALLSMPLPLAYVPAMVLGLLPSPPLTRDQVRLLKHDNVVDPQATGFDDLGIVPKAAEAILPMYLNASRRNGRDQQLTSG